MWYTGSLSVEKRWEQVIRDAGMWLWIRGQYLRATGGGGGNPMPCGYAMVFWYLRVYARRWLRVHSSFGGARAAKTWTPVLSPLPD